MVEKQRIMFTTFHQSFSYEDFIEGIRATTDEKSGALRYEVMDGIFKQLCLNAEVKTRGSSTQSLSLNGRRIWKCLLEILLTVKIIFSMSALRTIIFY